MRPISRSPLRTPKSTATTPDRLGERVDASRYPWGWEQPDFDDTSWPNAAVAENGAPRFTGQPDSRRMLVPRSIPLMEATPERIARLRYAQGMDAPAGFPAGKTPVTIPAKTRVQFLLDQNHLTTAFLELLMSGGRGSTVTIRYAEALWMPGHRTKGNRDEIAGKEFLGYKDVFLPDGGAHRLFRPLFWRTWRYLELTVETAADPLILEDVQGLYTGYPFDRKSRFTGGPDELQRILDVGWRTARLCAHETYMDCPYYEQLQYAGDARIQMLVSLYMTGDARLMRNGIAQIDASRTAEGATLSRAPSALPQYIPPFSLWWIGMVHDYWMYVDDPSFARDRLPGVRSVLEFFARYQNDDGSLKPLPWWSYLDWVDGWASGGPPHDPDRAAASFDLQLALAYQWAADLEQALGSPDRARDFSARAGQLRSTIKRLFWNPDSGLFSETTGRPSLTQHANALAVLAGVVEGDQARSVMEKTLSTKALAPASTYFKFYLNRAAVKAGLGDRYLQLLDVWRHMLNEGLTTWAEREIRARSDCHAWGSSPNIELFRTVLGVDTAAPGFAKVRIEPHLGTLTSVGGTVPHPKGEIRLSLEVANGRLNASVALPAGVTGDFVWHNQSKPLSPGENHLTF